MATELGEVLREAGMAEVLPLPKARVPVVKFVVPETGTKVGWAAGAVGFRRAWLQGRARLSLVGQHACMGSGCGAEGW